MKFRTLSVLMVSGFVLTGCASMPSWLGGKKTDDTILPGTREEVLPPQKLPRGNAAAGGSTSRQGALSGSDTIEAPADCEPANPNYPECLTPEAGPDAGGVPQVDEESAVPQQ
jgi:hypothetical protein